MFQTEVKSTFARNVGEVLEEAFWEGCGAGMKEDMQMMMMSEMVVRVNVTFEQTGVLWVENWL